MKKITTLIILILFPNLQSASDWKHIEDLPGYVMFLSCPEPNYCFSLQELSDKGATQLFKSSDQGKTWKSIFYYLAFENPLPYLRASQSLSTPDTKHLYISFMDSEDILKSTDGGHTFNRVKLLNSDKKTTDIYMYDSLTGMALIHSEIFITFDGFKTIEKREYPESLQAIPNSWWIKTSCVAFKKKDIIQINFFGGQRKKFFDYNIITDEWYELTELDESEFYRVSFQKLLYLNDTLGYISALKPVQTGGSANEVIVRTSDGGYNWKIILDTAYTSYPWAWGLIDIDFYDERNGMAVGKYGNIFFTNDSGETWILSERGGDVFKRGGEAIYGPHVMKGQFAGQFPIIGTRLGGNLYRYEGDFFIFDFNPHYSSAVKQKGCKYVV